MIEPFEFVLPLLTPSLNVTTRRHWKDRTKELETWRILIAAARGELKRWERPKWPRVRLTIVRMTVQPIEDTDNLVGGMKQLIDALVLEGYFVSDKEAAIGRPDIRQVKVRHRKDQCTVVKIEPLDPAPGEERGSGDRSAQPVHEGANQP